MKDHAEKNKKPSTPISPPPPKLERKPSIDAEPKTLLRDELNLARVSLVIFFTLFILLFVN